MILKDQKLKKYDYFKGSFDEILELINTYAPKRDNTEYATKAVRSFGIFYSEPNNTLIMADTQTQKKFCKTKHTFADFRQLCENTFQNQ